MLPQIRDFLKRFTPRSACRAMLLLALPCSLAGQAFQFGEGTTLQYKGSLFAEAGYFPQAPLDSTQPYLVPGSGIRQDLTLQTPWHFDLRANAWLYFDPTERRRNRLFIDDLYLDFFSSHVELRAGYQVFSWKTVESVSQSDFLNQTDAELDFFDAPKIGELALRARLLYTLENAHTWEFYLLPYFQPTRLPETGNRYDFFASNPGLELSNGDPAYDYWGRWRPQAAARYLTTLFGTVDVGLFLFNGYQRFPLLRPFVSPSTGEVSFHHFYTPATLAGGHFQGAFGNWLLKGETAYHQFEEEVASPSSAVVDPFLSYSFGFEYTFYSVFMQSHDIGTLLELIGDTDSGKEPEELEGFRPFRNDVFAALRYAFNNTGDRGILAGWVFDYMEYDLLGRAEYEERVAGGFKIRLRASGFALVRSRQMKAFSQSTEISGNLSYNW